MDWPMLAFVARRRVSVLQRVLLATVLATITLGCAVPAYVTSQQRFALTVREDYPYQPGYTHKRASIYAGSQEVGYADLVNTVGQPSSVTFQLKRGDYTVIVSGTRYGTIFESADVRLPVHLEHDQVVAAS